VISQSHLRNDQEITTTRCRTYDISEKRGIYALAGFGEMDDLTFNLAVGSQRPAKNRAARMALRLRMGLGRVWE
jgi:hypothetical protein